MKFLDKYVGILLIILTISSCLSACNSITPTEASKESSVVSNSEINAVPSFIKVIVGGGNITLLSEDGSVWGWGDGKNPTDGSVAKLHKIIDSGVKEIYRNGASCIAIKDDGSAWVWGNDSGLFGDFGHDSLLPTKIKIDNVQSISVSRHVLLVKTDGSLWTWGANDFGQLGDGTNKDSMIPKQIIESGVTNASAGWRHSVVCMKNGTVWTWGYNMTSELGDGQILDDFRYVPETIQLSNICKVFTGDGYSIAIKDDGTLWSWGEYWANHGGIQGIDNTIPRQTFSCKIKSVDAGGNQILILKEDGSLWAWGLNHYGQLGDGTTEIIPPESPKQIVSSDVIDVSSNGMSTAIIKSDGSVWVCGQNDEGQLGDGTTNNILTPKMIIPPVDKAIDEVNSTSTVSNQIGSGNRISFKDSEIEKKVRLNLLKLPSEEVYEDELENILALSLEKPETLDDLRKITSLENLIVNKKSMFEDSIGNVLDITVLKNLTNLRELELYNSFELHDLVPIEGLSKLERLTIYDNKLSDISIIKSFIHLKTLVLSTNNIEDASAISQCKDLEYLYLSDNKIRDIKFCGDLIQLKALIIPNNLINDITPLKKIENLRHLMVYYNEISDLEPLRNMKKLETLYISGNPISDFNPVMSFYDKLTRKDFGPDNTTENGDD